MGLEIGWGTHGGMTTGADAELYWKRKQQSQFLLFLPPESASWKRFGIEVC